MRTPKSMRVIALLSVLLLLLIAAPVAYGGLSWSGTDPRVMVNGTFYDVTVAVPPNQWCQVEGPYQVIFHVPAGAEVALLSESVGGPDECGTQSQTSLQEHEGLDSVYVSILVPARGSLRVRATLQSGGFETKCVGNANREFACDGP